MSRSNYFVLKAIIVYVHSLIGFVIRGLPYPVIRYSNTWSSPGALPHATPIPSEGGGDGGGNELFSGPHEVLLSGLLLSRNDRS